MNPLKYQIERWVQDWHWEEKSHALAFEMGEFLFGFTDSLTEAGLSEKTVAKHEGNAWCIGNFTCHYSRHNEFTPDIFKYPPFHEIEFKRKVSDSNYAIQSYEATCNKLAKYVNTEGWKSLPKYDFELSDDIDDLCIGLSMLNREKGRGNVNPTINFDEEAKAISDNYVIDLYDVDSREEFLERMENCCKALDETYGKLDSISAEGNYFRTKIIAQLKSDIVKILENIEESMMNI
jgi:hypothetical protein